MLCVFGGLPGAGKSTLAKKLARHCGAVYLRIDSIEQALRATGTSEIGPQGYVMAYRLAEDNLRLGQSVVADCVNPLELTRRAWREVAARVKCECIEIEVVCSDAAEHRSRVESRVSEVPGLRLPTWEEVLNHEYEAWNTARVVVDTAGQAPDESLEILLRELKINSS